MKKVVVLIGALVVFAGAETIDSKLRYVIDGDTAKFASGICRFAYIDTPESKMNKKLLRDIGRSSVTAEEVIKAGRISSGYTKSIMIKGATYRLDIITRDRYKRDVCVIYDAEGRSINDKIIASGMGVPFWRYVPRSKKAKMISLVRDAKKNTKGLWRIYPDVMDMMN